MQVAKLLRDYQKSFYRSSKQRLQRGLPNLIKPPESASSHDFNGLQLIEFALTFHFPVSGFAHYFTYIEGN